MSINMSTYLYIAQLSIPPQHEDLFNDLYDKEHIPNILQVPGVESAKRYKLEWSEQAEMPQYLAVYELEDPQLPNTDTWKAASDKGEWSVKVRPHLTTRLHGMFKSINK